MENYTQTSTDFTLLGLFPPTRIGLFLFIVVVLIFLMALFGNVSMILLIFRDTSPHTHVFLTQSALSH
ncbi:Olfactory receptor 2L5 [Vulpes lagopus]